MVIFRNLTLQRILCLVFLWTALLSHTQLLFACEFMHGKPKLVCCCGEAMPDACPMSETCGMQKKTDQSQCCEVSQDSLIDVVMTPSSSTVELLTLLLDSSQPPPLISFQEFSPFPQLHFLPAAPPHEPWLVTSDRQAYLRTLRIRL